MEETWTILKVIQWTAGYFSRKGIEQARAEAEVLLAHVLGMDRIQLYLRFDQPLSAAELAGYREIIRRRAAHEPTQYITGRQEFWSLEFEVTPSVLIPRPETELLVEKSLEFLESSGNSSDKTPEPAIVDLGTGSGAIAVALAHERPSSRVIATDRSPEALAVAKRNAMRHHVEDRIFFAAMDLLSGFRPSSPLFDLIVSNPPYIGEAEFAGLAPEIARHEPAGALRGGGNQGLDIIRRIINNVPVYLKPGGMLLLEVGQGQPDLLRDELAASPHIDSFEFIRDYSGILRVVKLRRISR